MTNVFLLKALTVALTISQILTQPEVRLNFDPNNDQQLALKIYQAGCQKLTDSLSAEIPAFKDLDIQDYLNKQITSAQNLNQTMVLFKGITYQDAKEAHALFCLGRLDPESKISLPEILRYYNATLRNLPSPQALADLKLPEYSEIKDAQGQTFTSVYRASRRKVVPLAQIPVLLQKAFISAEDKRFYLHHGVDERGVIRAGFKNFSNNGDKREEGGSTLTQQLVKNLSVGDDLTYERKIREMVIAFEAEKLMSKDRILEMYMNYVYLGRAAWGVAQAAESYFGKSLDQLTLAEMAFLAGMPKGPRFYNPDANPERSLDRTKYVLGQMVENKFITKEEAEQAKLAAAAQTRIAVQSPAVENSGYFLDELIFSMRKQLKLDPRSTRLDIESTLHPKLQTSIEGVLQEGLAQYELRSGRAQFSGPELNLAANVVNGDWLSALQKAKSPLTDVHWPLAVVLESGKKGFRVGLSDGQVVPLKSFGKKSASGLKLYDVVFVQPSTVKGNLVAELRFRPQVQGALTVMENKTGRIVSMVGGFSHALSHLNRAVHMVRQPGSTVKPLTYLAALASGLQPNTLVWDSPVELESSGVGAEVWAPNSAEGEQNTELVTLRRGLEESRNRVTARLLKSISYSPERSLSQVLRLMEACGVHDQLPNYWSTIIGGMEVPMINMVTCFATLANGGYRPVPHFFEDVRQNGQLVQDYQLKDLSPMGLVDDASYYQLRTIMQGVVSRGTAKALSNDLADIVKAQGPRAQLSDFVGGKTGTSQHANDAWFIGFTNDLTIAVWVGYDNASKKTKRDLGKGTGASVAAPIFGQALRATLQEYPLRRLDAPLPSAAVNLLPRPVRVSDGTVLDFGQGAGERGVAIDYFRLGADGAPVDTRQQLTSGEDEFYQDYN